MSVRENATYLESASAFAETSTDSVCHMDAGLLPCCCDLSERFAFREPGECLAYARVSLRGFEPTPDPRVVVPCGTRPCRGQAHSTKHRRRVMGADGKDLKPAIDKRRSG